MARGGALPAAAAEEWGWGGVASQTEHEGAGPCTPPDADGPPSSPPPRWLPQSRSVPLHRRFVFSKRACVVGGRLARSLSASFLCTSPFPLPWKAGGGAVPSPGGPSQLFSSAKCRRLSWRRTTSPHRGMHFPAKAAPTGSSAFARIFLTRAPGDGAGRTQRLCEVTCWLPP